MLDCSINSVVECYLHTVEVTGSSPVSSKMKPTIAEKHYITYLPQSEYENIINLSCTENKALAHADLTATAEEAEVFLKNVRTFAEFLFSRIRCKNISPIASLLLQQEHKFDTAKGEDLISGIISSLCTLSGKPVQLLIGNADAVQKTAAFTSFLALLNDKYSNRENFPTFESVIVTGKFSF